MRDARRALDPGWHNLFWIWLRETRIPRRLHPSFLLPTLDKSEDSNAEALTATDLECERVMYIKQRVHVNKVLLQNSTKPLKYNL